MPCNPTWTEAQRQLICGAGSVCCPFQALDPARDCVIDPDTNRWRAVRGTDIPALSTWGNQHTTNQDPQGQFIRRWVPELAKVPLPYLAAPWTMDSSVQHLAGCQIGVDYPAPIVVYRKHHTPCVTIKNIVYCNFIAFLKTVR
mgnify:CR=1 FL=1